MDKGARASPAESHVFVSCSLNGPCPPGHAGPGSPVGAGTANQRLWRRVGAALLE